MSKGTIIEAQNSNTVYEEGKSTGILGKLKGIFADYKHGTRNADRLYTEELWDNRVFGSEDVMEALETKTLFGELDHPEGDRCETLAKNAAISITKLEKKPDEGVIYGEAEILDTPTGRIVKALADSGAKLGISSRGMGEEIYENGQNIIDPDTYDFITFDVVVTPANTKARVALTESKHNSLLIESFKKEIIESETLNQLNQIKKVVENTNITEKENVINLIQEKICKINNVKATPKLEEANKIMALNLIKLKLKEAKEGLDKSIEANNSLSEENAKLIEEKEFYRESKEMLKLKLKEAKCQENNKIKELELKLEESIKANKVISNNDSKRNETILKLKSLQNKKIENLQSQYKEEINKLIEENNKIKEENNKIKEENNKLTESNNNLSINCKDYSKILSENKDLQNEVNSLRKIKLDSANKLTESKRIQENTIKQLQEKISYLEANQVKMEEAENRFSKLAFNPIGTVKAVAENFSNADYTSEDMDLFNALINK